MTRARTGAERRAELEFHASGFLVKVEGSWTVTALAQFRDFLNLRRLSPSTQELKDTLINVKQKYFDGKNRLYLCVAEPCCSKIGFDMSDGALDRVRCELGLPISKTGCQGPASKPRLCRFELANEVKCLRKSLRNTIGARCSTSSRQQCRQVLSSSMPERPKIFVTIRFTIMANQAPI